MHIEWIWVLPVGALLLVACDYKGAARLMWNMQPAARRSAWPGPTGFRVIAGILRFLADRLREHRRALGTRWRRLSAGRQALLTLAHLRNGQPYAQLAAGFGIGTTTVYRYITEAVELLATLRRAPGRPRPHARRSGTGRINEGVPDPGRHPSGDRLGAPPGRRLGEIAADRPFYSGKHKKHGMNVQVIADPKGRLLWAAPALAGAAHDVRAAREHGIIDALTEAGINCWADKGYQGGGGTVRLPYRGRWDSLSIGQQAVNRSHAKVRALVEQAIATLKSWRLLRKLRCSTTRITSIVRAVLTLRLASSG